MKSPNARQNKKSNSLINHNQQKAAPRYGLIVIPKMESIEQRAYALAEGRGFAPGHEVDDWLEAERQTM